VYVRSDTTVTISPRTGLQSAQDWVRNLLDNIMQWARQSLLTRILFTPIVFLINLLASVMLGISVLIFGTILWWIDGDTWF
jgi:hypothetical protein